MTGREIDTSTISFFGLHRQIQGTAKLSFLHSLDEGALRRGLLID
jgi:hypothetical protein